MWKRQEMSDGFLGEISAPHLISDCRLLCVSEGSVGQLIKWTEGQGASTCNSVLPYVVPRPFEFAIVQKMKDESGSWGKSTGDF